LIVNHPENPAPAITSERLPIDNEAMTEGVFKADHDRQRKMDREDRLQWQSRLLLLVVLTPAVIGLVLRTIPVLTPASAEGLAICAAFGLLVWLLRAATPFAAVVGFLLTACLYLGTVDQPNGGWFHTTLSPGLALFVLAFAATRFRRGQKEQIGLAESRRGRRASQVAANMGVAALAAIALPYYTRSNISYGWFTHGWTFISPTLFTPLVTALAEAAADTVSSEIGQAIGGTPRLITNGRRVRPGTDGGITLAGTAAGCIAAAIVALVAMATLRLDPRQVAVAWIAAIAGLFSDSLIGATLERRGWLNNDLVNFLSTGIAALIAAFGSLYL
jgi:uncharacterized protein (TIGR00297 family)